MRPGTLLQASLAGAACAAALWAAEAWKNKDYTQWTSEDVNKVLTDSPWAKQKNVTLEQSGPEQRRGSRGGGMGRGGGGYPGGGYPGGGGVGYPGGGVGYPGGGGGYPGGGYPGGGYPGGGPGYPGGRGTPGTYPDDDSRGSSRRLPSMNVVVRWESALPVQQALLRQGLRTDDESKPAAQPSEQKDYVITVVGWMMPGRRARSADGDLDDDRDSRANDNMRSQLLDAARLVPRGKNPIYAEDVQIEGPSGASGIRFLFPKTAPISADDKDVTFYLESRGMKLEHKFHLPDMTYQGKLAL